VSFWKKSLIYLGLLEEEMEEEQSPKTPLHPAPSNVRRIPRETPLAALPTPGTRQLGPVEIVKPASRVGVKPIGDKFRAGEPVMVDLRGTEDQLARWVTDFVYGLVYGLDGRVDRLAGRVYFLAQPDLSISADERRSLAERVMALG
jgi:cell division inhibitor SepF